MELPSGPWCPPCLLAPWRLCSYSLFHSEGQFLKMPMSFFLSLGPCTSYYSFRFFNLRYHLVRKAFLPERPIPRSGLRVPSWVPHCTLYLGIYFVSHNFLYSFFFLFCLPYFLGVVINSYSFYVPSSNNSSDCTLYLKIAYSVLFV